MDRQYYAEYYRIEDRHWWFVGRRNVFLRALDLALEVGGGAAGRKVLDVGCGTGTMLTHLARYGETTGLDMDGEAVNYCRERGHQRVVQISDPPWPLPDSTFDLVTLLDVLEHADDDVGLLREIRRVAVPGALVMISVPAYRFLWGPQDVISHHRRRYRARQLREVITGAGLVVERLTYFNSLLFPPIAALRLVRRLLPAPRELKSDFTVAAHPLVNGALGWIFSQEKRLVPRLDLPFGVSILALARTPGILQP